MKYRIGMLVLLLASAVATVFADDMEARYQAVRASFDAREKTASDELKRYLLDYPYTTYRSDVNLMSGVLLVEKKKYKRAMKEFEKVSLKDLGRDDRPQYYFYAGYALMQMGKTKEAMRYFQTLKDSNNPYTVQGKYFYAYCQYSMGDYSKALPVFLEIEKSAQYRQIVPYYVIQIYYARHNENEVYQRAEYLLRTNPTNGNNAEIHRILGELYYAKGDYKQALEHLSQYDQSCTSQKKEILRPDMYLKGVSAYQMGEYETAVGAFRRVKQQKDTISESTCLYLGNSYIRLKDVEKAKLSYSAAMGFRIDPKVREEAMYNYALTTYQSGTALGESISAFSDFLHEYPNTSHKTEVYQLLAEVYMSSKNYRAALEAVNAIPEQTAKVQDIRQYLRYQIGVDAFLQGRMQETEDWMNQVIAAEPKTSAYKTDAYYYCAEAAYRLRRYDDCYTYLSTFLKQPNNLSANRFQTDYLLGYSLFSLQRFTDAEAAFRRFVSGKDGDKSAKGDALNRIGDCCFNRRAFDDAIQAYRQVMDMKATGADYAIFQTGYALGLQRHYGEKVDMMERLVKQHPKSDYADDALYEIARANLSADHNEQAIDAYKRLIANYPNSNLARQSSLEMAMIYRNINNADEAIRAFQQTIQSYPGSKESYAALEALEQMYVEQNRITDYLAYTKQISKMNMTVTNQEDSLTYVTAELQYMMGNYKEAAVGLATYLSRFCYGGKYCTTATWYAADCHYQLGNHNEAIELYLALTEIDSNPYREDTHTRLAELLYEKKDYAEARKHFEKMRALSQQEGNRIAANLGVLRCSFFLEDDTATINVATRMLEDKSLKTEVRDEALYNRGKAYYRAGMYGQAAKDFAVLSQNVRVVTGAEAAFLVADCYYKIGALESAESEVMRFTQQKTQHQYWLAKSLILLADINVARGELFQAKQYLLSLQANYRQQDDIQTIITQRLSEIAEQEKANEAASETANETEEETENDVD